LAAFAFWIHLQVKASEAHGASQECVLLMDLNFLCVKNAFVFEVELLN
jgi:hypothetical protein